MISIKQAKPLVMKCFKKRIVPYLVSSPGIGKSSLGMQIAKETKYKFIDVRLAQADPTDLNGFPAIVNGEATFIPFDIFPTTDTPIPEGYFGWILMLDELSSCPRSIQAAAYKIILDHKVGNRDLHPKVLILAAGNGINDNAHVVSMSTALQSRMVHLEIGINVQDLIQHAIKAGWDSRVVSFMGYRPELLTKYDPKHNDHTFACPRTFEMLSNLVNDEPIISTELVPLLDGTIGKGASVEFRNYCAFFDKLPTLASVLSDPENVGIPYGAGMVHAFTSMLTDGMTVANGDTIMKCVSRLGMEFQAMCVLGAYNKNPSIEQCPSIEQWIDVNSARYM